MRPPRIVLTELREYRSQSGSTYFAGYLGKTRLVMLRDDRAACTGREVARWNILLEEPQPRDVGGGTEVRSVGPRPERSSSRQAGRQPPASAAEVRERRAENRRAASLLRERGIDPSSAPPDDAMPF